MLIKSGVSLLLLAVIQVSARYKTVEPDFNENEINPQAVAVPSPASRFGSGWMAQPGQYPHHAALRMVNPTGTIAHGGGAIVSRQWVITAAVCVTNRVSVIVRAGVLQHNDNNSENIFETTEWRHHPSYNNLSTLVQPNNIALIKLQRPVVYSDLLRAIRVQSHADAYRNYDGQQVYASGYGSTASGARLRGVYLRAISNSVCARTYSMTLVPDSGICAQFFNITSQSVCGAERGLPLVHVGIDGVPTLIGVFSFHLVGCPLGSPYGFVRPGPYLSWFNIVTGIDFDSLREDTTSTSTSTTTTTTSTSTTTTTTPTPTTTTTTTPTPTTTTTTTLITTPTTSTTTTTPSASTIITPTTSIITTPSISTTSSTTTMTAESEKPEPEDTTAAPEDSEDNEEDNTDSSECNEDDEMAQLQKRIEVNVKVKVGLNKYMSRDKNVGKI